MLQELKKLDLSWTNIEEVPEGMDMLIKIRYLGLQVFTPKEIPAGLLPKLVHLQHLSFDVDNEKTSLKAEEMEPLKKLECLTGRFEDIELKKLDLSWTNIEEVPEGMDMLIKIRYLGLQVFTPKEIPAGLLPKLVHLQHLSFDVDNEKTSLKAEEMEPLKKLECLTGRFEDIGELNKFISSMQQSKKNLIEYYLLVGPYIMGRGREKTVTIGEVENWEGELIMHPIEIQLLNIVNCDYLRSLVDDNSSFKNAIDLKVCGIWGCEGIECVVSVSSFASFSAQPFQSLEVLYLRDLPKLSALIMKDEGIGSATTSTLAPSATFSHLKKLR
ncbi:hypothetical protein GOBAR_DD36261 [Gossypium barbadense]|nr:hypothetical protein GOBAR_DD36261 [Gossypium barbadense]